MIALTCFVVGFLAGLFVCGVHWMHRVRQELLQTVSPDVSLVLRRLLRWPA